MSAAAITHYTSLVRYDPQAVQRMRDATAQARQQQQQWPVRRDQQGAPVEQTLEGELLNKQGEAQNRAPEVSEEEYLERHEQQRSRAAEGYQPPLQRAVAAYQTVAQLTHPADVDRVSVLDVYA